MRRDEDGDRGLNECGRQTGMTECEKDEAAYTQKPFVAHDCWQSAVRMELASNRRKVRFERRNGKIRLLLPFPSRGQSGAGEERVRKSFSISLIASFAASANRPSPLPDSRRPRLCRRDNSPFHNLSA